MAFTNSSLVNYTKLSPNHSGQRNHKIDTITIHCVVGQCSVETLGNVFAPTSRQASSNYGVGSDGRIGMYVEEKNRSWCTSSSSNDNRAITIEVASDTKEPYAVNSKAYASLIKLVADICKRNGIKELKWKGDKSLIGQVSKQNMTVHRWFAATACPGTYLYNKMGTIASDVNKALGKTATTTSTSTTSTNKPATTSTTSTIKKGDVVSIASNATYYDGSDVPSWVKNKKWIVSEVSGNRAVIDKSSDGINSICSPINTKFLKATSTSFKAYAVKVNVSALNIRKGPGTKNAVVGIISDRGTYTIISESKGSGSTKGWGKLKSGAGWISLDYVTKK